MSDPSPDTLQSLANLVCDGKLTQADVEQLEKMLKGNVEAQRLYLAHVRLDGYLRWECGHQTHAKTEPTAAPALNLFFTALHGTIGFFSQEIPFSLLIATVITCLGLLGGSLIYVTHHQQVADDNAGASKKHPAQRGNYLSDLEFVGRITGLVDVTWADTQTATVHGANVPIGRNYELASGLLEITYDTGAKVILQGPVTYKVDSRDGGFLSVGKLTARLEKKGAEVRGQGTGKVAGGQWPEKVVGGQWSVASETNPEIPKSQIPNPSSSPDPRPQSPAPTFAVRTPTATVTDLGTEFGVYVAANGLTQVHVLKGAVEACAVNSQGNWPMHQCVIEGNAIEIDRKEQALTTIHYAPHLFARKMPDLSAQPLCETLYSKVVLADEPLGYWPLSEPAGSRKFIDLSGNGFHGYAMNKVSAGLPGPLGNNSRSLALDGTGGYIDIGRHDEFALANNLTVESWLWIKDIGIQAKVISACKSTIAGGDGVGWALHLGRKDFSANVQEPITIDWTTYWVYADMWFSLRQNDVPKQQWRHVAVVFDGSNTAQLYLNGAPCGKIVGRKPANVGPVWVEIGRGDVNTGFWNGRLAHIAVYPRSLSAENIRKHYQTAIQLQSTDPPKD